MSLGPAVQRLARRIFRISEEHSEYSTYHTFPIPFALRSPHLRAPLLSLWWKESRSRHTKWGPVPDITAEEVARAHGLELRKALKESLALGSLADAGSPDKDDARCFAKSHAIRDASLTVRSSLDVYICAPWMRSNPKWHAQAR